eukprot:365353-Chlamydomonas_euryale.AAC.16
MKPGYPGCSITFTMRFTDEYKWVSPRPLHMSHEKSRHAKQAHGMASLHEWYAVANTTVPMS